MVALYFCILAFMYVTLIFAFLFFFLGCHRLVYDSGIPWSRSVVFL